MVAGGDVTYTLTVRNSGQSAAEDVVVSDTMPNGLTATSASASNGATCELDVRCDLGTLAPNEVVTITILAKVSQAAGNAELTNSASVSSSTADPSPGDNTASVTTPVKRSADLSISKTVGKAVGAGGNLTWTIKVHNNGPSQAADVVVTDALPAGLTVASIASDRGDDCDESVRCELGKVDAGEEVVITVVTRTDPDSDTTTITNRASVKSTTADPNPGNNTSSARARVIGPSVGLAKQVDLEPVIGKDGKVTIGWRLNVVNDGGVDLRDVQVVDDLAKQLANFKSFEVFTLASPTLTVNPSYNGTTDTNLLAGTDELAEGESAAIFLRVVIDSVGSSGDITNSARVSAVTPEGVGVADVSTRGATPDADGNGFSGDDSEPTGAKVPDLPRTGAAAAMWLWFGALLVACGGAYALRTVRRQP